MDPKWHPVHRHLQWRPPKSDWWSSPLSPNDDNLKQRWHKTYGRLGRRYETRTTGGPSVAEDHGPWQRDYRRNLKRWAATQAGPRGIANRRIPTANFRPPYNPETRPGGTVLDVNDFPSRLSRPQSPSDDARPSSDRAPIASGSAVAEEEAHPRYTAAQKGKQREGEPPSSSGSGPSAIKRAVPKDPQSTAPGTTTEGLRVPPRHHSPGDEDEEDEEDEPSVKHVELAKSKSAAMARALSKAREAVSIITARSRLAEARVQCGFAPVLPLDGLGVVHNRTRPPMPPAQRRKLPSSSAMKRTQTQMGAPGPSSQAGSVMMERTESRARVPDPNSQEYAHLMAESNRRLEELSPYSPEDKVPDTPKPDPEGFDDNDDQPPPSAPLPPSQSPGHVPSPKIPNPYHAPILRAKRNASEMSGGLNSGPSSHRQAPAPFAPSATVATMSVNGQERGIS